MQLETDGRVKQAQDFHPVEHSLWTLWNQKWTEFLTYYCSEVGYILYVAHLKLYALCL